MRNSCLFSVLLTTLSITSCNGPPPAGETMNTPSTQQPVANDTLHMQRFKGLESYQIESAKWNLYRDEDPQGMNLCLRVECSKAIKQFEDTAYVGGKPDWELNLVQPVLEDSSLHTGFKAEIPASYDESRGGWITNFYFTSHEGSEKNQVEVLSRDGDRLLIRLTGEIVDVNHYDDSKPRSKVSVTTWFSKDEKTKRSMQ